MAVARKPSPPLGDSLDALDETIHQKVRLGVMSALMARGECDFRFLKNTLSVTDGNLSIHLAKLEEAGYIVARKEFVGRKPHSSYAPTLAGKAAFTAYLTVLEQIVESSSRRFLKKSATTIDFCLLLVYDRMSPAEMQRRLQ